MTPFKFINSIYLGSLFSVGSGSLFAYGVLDEGYSYDLEVEAAKDLATRSIYHATYRDAASGGFVNCKSFLYLPIYK